jgi:hypothetical protein
MKGKWLSFPRSVIITTCDLPEKMGLEGNFFIAVMEILKI